MLSHRNLRDVAGMMHAGVGLVKGRCSTSPIARAHHRVEMRVASILSQAGHAELDDIVPGTASFPSG